MKTIIAATLLAASLAGITAPATAHADCGDPGQDSCTGPAPSVDQVVGIMQKLTDPNVPAANKSDIVTPGFSPDEAGTIDDRLHQMDSDGLLPLGFVVTNIQPAPNNFAGATVASTGGFHQRSFPGPIVLADQRGHWMINHDSAWTALDNFWYNANRAPNRCRRGTNCGP
jgi:hypothetical protein